MSANNQCECATPLSGGIDNSFLFQMCDGGEGTSISAIDISRMISDNVVELDQVSREEGVYTTQIDDTGIPILTEASIGGEVILDRYELLLGSNGESIIEEGSWGIDESKVLVMETTPPEGYTHAIITIQTSIRGNFDHNDTRTTDEFGNLLIDHGFLQGPVTITDTFADDQSQPDFIFTQISQVFALGQVNSSNIVYGVKVPVRFDPDIDRHFIILNDVFMKDKAVILTGFSLSEVIDGEQGEFLGDDSIGSNIDVDTIGVTFLNHDYNLGGIPTTTIDWLTDETLDIAGGETYELQIDFGGGNIHIEQVAPIIPIEEIQQAIITWSDADIFKTLRVDVRVKTTNRISRVITSNSGINSQTNSSSSITVT